MKLIFLGTSSMVPTKERNHTSQILLYDDEGILVDCGEGTQRQLRFARIKPSKITKILITHWHGDHVFGLPGLMQTLGSEEYSGTLKIYGPKGSKKNFENIMKAFLIETKIDFEVHEVNEGIFFESPDFALSAMPMYHGVPCVGYRFQEKDTRKINMAKAKKLGIPEGPLLGKIQKGKEIIFEGKTINPEEISKIKKGKSVCFIFDTKLTKNSIALADNCDLLVCESTFATQHEEKAGKYKHLTAKQAALIANNANAKKLVLTHFSQRYKNTQEIEEEASELFDNVITAQDLMVLTL